ncbi:hypothetical protein ACFX1T_037857 [Malus domestica]
MASAGLWASRPVNWREAWALTSFLSVEKSWREARGAWAWMWLGSLALERRAWTNRELAGSGREFGLGGYYLGLDDLLLMGLNFCLL